MNVRPQTVEDNDKVLPRIYHTKGDPKQFNLLMISRLLTVLLLSHTQMLHGQFKLESDIKSQVYVLFY